MIRNKPNVPTVPSGVGGGWLTGVHPAFFCCRSLIMWEAGKHCFQKLEKEEFSVGYISQGKLPVGGEISVHICRLVVVVRSRGITGISNSTGRMCGRRANRGCSQGFSAQRGGWGKPDYSDLWMQKGRFGTFNAALFFFLTKEWHKWVERSVWWESLKTVTDKRGNSWGGVPLGIRATVEAWGVGMVGTG